LGSGIGKLIKWPNHKVLEGKARVEIGAGVHRLERKLGRRRGHGAGFLLALGASRNNVFDIAYALGEHAQAAQNVFMKFIRQPIARKLRGNSEEHYPILEADNVRISKPRIEIGARYGELELNQRIFPKFFRGSHARSKKLLVSIRVLVRRVKKTEKTTLIHQLSTSLCRVDAPLVLANCAD